MTGSSEEGLVDGGLSDESAILPWAVSSVDPEHADCKLALLADEVVDAAAETVVEYVGGAVLESCGSLVELSRVRTVVGLPTAILCMDVLADRTN